MIENFLELSNLTKTYPTPHGPAVIVKDVNLSVREGEFVCLIGQSGCGKSTVLSMVMGLNDVTEGGVVLDGREITEPGTDRGVVFQSACLLPWLSARDNVLLAVNQVKGGERRSARQALAEKALNLVGLDGSGDQYPDDLSAGMRQRVGIARAFALEPRVLLLDEPFSLLDALTRLELQDELVRLWENDRKTVLMVTHDVDEALFLADRIVMLTQGPAATIGGILSVPFPLPRTRADVLNHPEYYQLRDRLINFLESGIPASISEEMPEESKPNPYAPTEEEIRDRLQLSEEERFVVEKYTGFNRFLPKFKKSSDADR